MFNSWFTVGGVERRKNRYNSAWHHSTEALHRAARTGIILVKFLPQIHQNSQHIRIYSSQIHQNSQHSQKSGAQNRYQGPIFEFSQASPVAKD